MTAYEERVRKLELGSITFERRMNKMDADVIAHVTEMQRFMLEGFASVAQRFDGVDKRLDGVDKRLDGIDNRLDGIDNRFDSVDGKLAALDGKLNRVIDRLDAFIETQGGINRDVESRLRRRTRGR